MNATASLNYSLIIPHYNIPKLLQRLLDSFPPREDTEIIIVDDCSDPSIVAFDAFPGHDRPDVKLIFAPRNGGAGYARNLALEVARGKKLLFADADDFFLPNIGEVLDDYRNDESDMVFCTGFSLHSDTFLRSTRLSLLSVSNVINTRKAERAIHYLRYYHRNLQSRLVSRTMVETHHIRCNETRVNNDNRFAVLCGIHAESIKLDKRAIYCITRRDGSLVMTYLSHLSTHLHVQSEMLKRLQDHKVKLNWSYSGFFHPFILQLRAHQPELYEQALHIAQEEGLNVRSLRWHLWYKQFRRKALKAFPLFRYLLPL